MEALGWLLYVLGDPSLKKGTVSVYSAEIGRYLTDHCSVDDMTSSGSYSSYYAENTRHQLLHSQTRTDAVILESLVVCHPESPTIPLLVRGLLDKRIDGRWNNTQENAWASLALRSYFRGLAQTCH